MRSASIIISNYNYARFLRASMDSALAQTYADTEVIVVDDGSTDDSRERIAAYGARVSPVLKPNGGQASAFNAGFAASRGDVVIFLDADDELEPCAVDRAVTCFTGDAVSKVHWPLLTVDATGAATGATIPPGELADGDLHAVVARAGPDSYVTPPMSGNAWSRRFLDRVLPMPEPEFRIFADGYLSALAPLYGLVRTIPTPLGRYRTHGGNNYWGRTTEKLGMALRAHERMYIALQDACRELAIPADPEAWRRASWLHRLGAAIAEIDAIIPSGDPFVLVDEDQWATGGILAGRRCVPFLERDGHYWGAPPDDATAVGELERLSQAGARFVVFAWPAFWWLGHYAGLRVHLEVSWRQVLASDHIVAFECAR